MKGASPALVRKEGIELFGGGGRKGVRVVLEKCRVRGGRYCWEVGGPGKKKEIGMTKWGNSKG